MADMHGTATWSGAPALPVLSASYTCGHGVTPGVGQFVTPWMNPGSIRQNGTLTFRDGVHTPISIRACRIARIDETELQPGVPGLAFTLVDARDRWRYGSIDGWYNQIDAAPDPTTVPVGKFGVKGGIYVRGTERTPAELMALCFSLLSQPVTFRDVPKDERPVVDWKGENPARAADRVAEAVGCRVIYQPIFDRVLVAPPGGVTKLDRRFPMVSDRPTADTAARPTRIDVIGGDTLVTDHLKLEAVGWEEDGRLRPIQELSYRPADNWWNYTPDYRSWWQSVRIGDCTSIFQARALAATFVWKLFRVAGVPLDPLRGGKGAVNRFNWAAPVFGIIPNRKLITISDKQVLPEKDAAGQYVTKPADVLWNGANFPQNRAEVLKNFVTTGDPEVPFGVDAERGLVTFSRCMYRVREKSAAGGDVVPEKDRQKLDKMYGPAWNIPGGRLQYILADTYLRCAVRVRDPITWQYRTERWSLDVGADPGGELVEIVRRPELQLVVRVPRDTKTLARGVIKSNAAEVNARAAVVLDAAALKHQPAAAGTRQYVGILPIEPDSVIQQVTWSVGDGPPTTTASYNAEHTPFLPTFEERRKNERALDFLTAEWVRTQNHIEPPLSPD